MGSLGSAFVQEPEHRPNSADEATGVPLIDLSLSSAQSRENLLLEIRRACRDWGFFQVVNHGIPSELRDRAVQSLKRFFEQEPEEKARVRKDEVWSNKRYESVEHRVMLNSERDRYSIPFFYNPGHHVMVEPVRELVSEREPAKYRPYNWGKFLATRKRSNFTKLDVENLQIHHFRVQEQEK